MSPHTLTPEQLDTLAADLVAFSIRIDVAEHGADLGWEPRWDRGGARLDATRRTALRAA